MERAIAAHTAYQKAERLRLEAESLRHRDLFIDRLRWVLNQDDIYLTSFHRKSGWLYGMVEDLAFEFRHSEHDGEWDLWFVPRCHGCPDDAVTSVQVNDLATIGAALLQHQAHQARA